MAGLTNKGIAHLLHATFRRTALPTNYYLALVTNDMVPTEDTNTLGELTEIVAGTGYIAGGKMLTPGPTYFGDVNEDDTGNLASVQILDVAWTGTGGPIPGSGNGASYAVLTDDNVTVWLREVYAFWPVGTNVSVVDGQTMTFQNLNLRGTQV